MQKKVKSKRSSVIFITTCLLICGSSLTYFFIDLNKTTLRKEKEIATVIFKKKIAQRKFSDSVVWERLQNKSPLYNEDTIRTDSDAQASIVFNNGASIDLDEKTMIQIFEGKNGELKFNISGGKFAVDTSESNAKVSLDLGNGSVVSFDKGTKMSADSAEGKNAFVIQEGNVNIQNADGTEDVILSGDSIKIDEKGQRKKFPVSVSNLGTTEKIVNFSEKESDVTLMLKTTPETAGEKIIVETSSDPNFTEILERKEITDSSVKSVSVKAASPSLFYRIFPENNKEDAFEGKLVVETIEKPKLLSPAVDSVFKNKESVPDVSLNWDCGDYCDYVKLEVYKESDPETPVIQKDISDDSITINKFDEGKYFWTITPHYSINNIGFGETVKMSSFEVVKEIIEMKPQLTIPQSESVVLLEDEGKDVVFMWKSDVKKSSYLLEIASDDKFKKIVYSNENMNTRDVVLFNLKKMPEKTYFWRVTRIDDKKVKFVSDTRTFDVKKYIPTKTELVLPLENFSAEQSVIAQTQFFWKLSDKYKKAKTQTLFEIAKDDKFQDVVKQILTSKTSCSDVKLSTGTYYWRITAVNKEDQKELFKTESRKINVLHRLEKPLITIPLNNTVQNLVDSQVLKVMWNKVEGADYYRVKIFNAETKEVVSQSNGIKDNQFNAKLENIMLDSKYVCSVTAYSDEKENMPARTSKNDSINVSFERAKKIVLQTPTNGVKLNGLAALRDGVLFKWSTDKSQKSSEFILTKINANGTSNTVFSSKKLNGSVKVSKLLEGNYRWTVVSKSENGTNLTPDTSFTFSVLKREPLLTPVLQVPSKDFVITSDYLKTNRKIRFEWNKVTDATDYTFVLYQIRENGSLKKIVSTNLTDSNFDFSDLKSLDVGHFEWHVTAFSHLKDGFEEQRSSEVSGKFSISFGLPSNVKTIDPGRMYGE